MATTVWAPSLLGSTLVVDAPGAQFAPAVADNGGTEFGVAYSDGVTVTVKFFDEQGLPTSARPTAIVTDGHYGATALSAAVDHVDISAGGTGIGYGLVWEESAAGQPTLLRLRYIGLSTTFGPEISVSTSATGFNQHDASIAGYTKDAANGVPNVDGFELAWVESAGGAHTLGHVFFQRFAVPLDARKDPAAPPTAAGLDGRIDGDPLNNAAQGEGQVELSSSGRDPAVAVLLGAANESVIAWVDDQNQVHLRIFNDDGSINTTEAAGGPIGATGAPPDNLGTTAANGDLHVLALAGGEFVVAWIADVGGGDLVLQGRLYTPGAAGGTFTASPLLTLADVADTTADFRLAALPDGGGFMLAWNELEAATSAIFTRTFSAAGDALDPAATIFHAPADATNVAVTGLTGDRVVAVYQDNAIAGDPGNIGAQIFDTRTQAGGAPIVLDGDGLTLIGDVAGAGGVPDVLVGSIGNDVIDGLLNDDTLDGALGSDLIVAGGGNDVIDGGGGLDQLLLSGRFTLDGNSSNDDYSISFEGNGLFTITDLRSGITDGVDTVRNVESFSFAASGTTFTATQLEGQMPNVTPTPWGLTDEDTGSEPSRNRVADVDGFLVNTGPTSQPGAQSHPVVADSVGQFIGILWETAPDGSNDTFIRGQFLDVLGQPDTGTPMPDPINVSDGIGIEFNPTIVSGGANSGWGIAFEERGSASDPTSALRTNFVGPGTLTGPERFVFNEGENVNQHDAALSGSFLDRSATSPIGGSVGPKDVSDGYNVAWVSTPTDGSLVVPDASYGRIMLQRFEVPLDALGNPGAPVAGGIDGLAGLESDLPVWVGAEGGGNGVIGRNPSTAALHTFETAVIWIEQDGAGGERVAGRAYDDLGQVIAVPEFADISSGFPVAAGTNAYVVQAGAVNLGIAWITEDATSPSGYTVMGTMFSPSGAGLNGQDFGFVAPPQPFVLTQLPDGFDPTASDFHLTGISGENSADLVISWNLDGDIEARHIRTTLDPTTGVALSLVPEGNVVTVNSTADGVQDQNSIAGLLSDRFITVYHDTSNVTGDAAGDIVARILDTREPGQVLVGDTFNNGLLRTTADVIVGTVGDDIISGDVLDNDGRTDELYGGMGNDILRGGPDQSAGARVEILDGGEGTDTAVYTGRFADYSVATNGDGSFTVIDLRAKTDAAGNPVQNDGTDFLFNVEQLQFLGEPGAPVMPFGFNPPLPPPDPAFDGTPSPWSLSDESLIKEILVSVNPLDPAASQLGVQKQIAVAGLQTDAAMTWVSQDNHIFAVRYDTLGQPDPLFSTVPVELTDAALADTVTDPFVGMVGGLGFLTAWEATTGGATSIHFAFGSTATNTAFDPAAGFPGPGLAKQAVGVATDDANIAEDTVAGSSVANRSAFDPVVQGYEIVNDANDTLEFGFHVAYVLKANATDAVGDIQIARYDIPVYDVDPLTGALLLDANNNPAPSINFGRGAETQPISVGTDGLRGTADDDAAAITIGVGRDVTLAGLHDGQLVVSYIDTADHVHLRIFAPSTDQTADRETRPGAAGSDIVVGGLTTFEEMTLPFASDLGSVAAGQKAYVAAQQNGSFGVFWAQDGAAGTVDIKAIVYTFGGVNNWIPSDVLTLETGLNPAIAFQVANTAVNPVGLEDGFLLTWNLAGSIFEQRVDMAGNLVGGQIRIDDPDTGPHSGLSVAPIEDGRILVGYESPTGDVAAQYLDTRQPGIDIIGPRLGAPRDVLVGTVGNDNMTGGQLNDELHGGLGNDVLSGGSGADLLDGGKGGDTLIGSTGQDQLLGGEGDDLLWGGLSGPADPKVDRDLRTGLLAAGIDPTLVASEPGADLVSGGDGSDTISFQGEFGKFQINLATGIIGSDRDNSGNFLLEDVIGQIVDDGAGGTIFTFSNDVENARGGLGDDTLIGNAGDNIFAGGAGTNVIDGGAGSDTLLLPGNLADMLVSFDAATQIFTIVDPTAPGGPLGLTDIARNIEVFSFQDGDRLAADLVPGPIAANDTITVAEDSAVTFDVRTNDAGSGLQVFAVNGTSIAAGGPAISVLHGQVTLGGDGLLTYTPNANFFGQEVITYSVADAFDRFSTANATITVTNVNDAPDDILFNGQTAPTLLLAENSPNNTVVATLSTHDVDNVIAPGTDSFVYTLANNFGGAFKIVGNQIQVQNGALLDFEGVPNAFNLEVTVSDGHPGGTHTETVTVNLTNVNEAPINVALSNTSFAETAANGFAIGTFNGTDPEGSAVKYGLTSDADGRFKIVFDAATNTYKLAVAENLLIDHQTTDANHIYAIQVAATDASGSTSLKSFNITATGVAENRVTGTAADNNLGGSNGNDYIDGGAGKDTMTGGTGNDVYFVDNTADKVIEQANANSGTDTIYTTLTSFDLNSAANVENLVFIGTGNFSFIGRASNGPSTVIGGAGADNLQGGNGSDTLEGRSGNDVLQGGNGNDSLIGGAGNDTLNGGNGDDTFVFAPGFGNDVIQTFGDVAGNQDVIEVSDALFADLAALQAAMVQSGTNVIISDGVGDVLTVQGTTIAALGIDDFRFL